MSLGIIGFYLLFSPFTYSKVKFNTDKLHAIYGKDNRYEALNYSDPKLIEKSKSVAIKINTQRLLSENEESIDYNFLKRSLKKENRLFCENIPYADQVSLGECSGFLITKNILVTAGHCMEKIEDCSEFSWAFDYLENSDRLLKKDVYKCKKIIAQKKDHSKNHFLDYALIELDREVADRIPLEIRLSGKIKINTEVVMIGYPLGLPLKIADKAKVTRMNKSELKNFISSFFLKDNYFTTNLDSFASNSGSPVINKETGLVEGIIVQGNEDFKYNEEKNCIEAIVYSDSRFSANEKVMRITKIPFKKIY